MDRTPLFITAYLFTWAHTSPGLVFLFFIKEKTNFFEVILHLFSRTLMLFEKVTVGNCKMFMVSLLFLF